MYRLNRRTTLALVSVVILSVALSGCVGPPPPDFIGSFEITIQGVGGYGKGARFGDAFIKITMKGALWAWNETSPSLKLKRITLIIAEGKMKIVYFNATNGEWNIKLKDLAGSVLSWEGDDISGVITGGTWKVDTKEVKFCIKWNKAFTSGSITGSIRVTTDIDSIPLTIYGSIVGKATHS